MTLHQKEKIMSNARKKSLNGEVTYVLIYENRSVVTQDDDLALKYVNHGYKLYAKYKDGTLIL